MDTANTPLLSVIVPTRNRARYARHCIRNILASPSDLLECVVLDNSEGDELEEYVRALQDPRVRYRHVRARLTLSQVFGSAYQLSTGRFVTFIGDDDGVLPQVVEVAGWMETNGVDSLTTPLLVSYGWTDFEVKYGLGFHRGEVVLRHFGGTVSELDVEAELRRSAAASFQDFGRLTRLYYGIVARTATDRAVEKTGALFWGASPDISGCVAVASYVRRHVLFDFPLFIGGSSGGSAAGRAGRNEHYGSLRDETHTRDYADQWPAEVPPFFAEETVWAHAALLTLEKHGRRDVLKFFNSARLHGKSLALSPWKYKANIARSFQSRVLGASHQPLRDTFECISSIAKFGAMKWLRYGYRATRVGYLWKYKTWAKGVGDVASAAAEIDGFLKSRGSHAIASLSAVRI